MNNKTNIEENIEIVKRTVLNYNITGEFKSPDYEDLDNIVMSLENILADRERLIKEKMELKEKINKKDKTIETMRFIKNTSKYEDTILIDEDITTARKNRYLIELKNGEFIEANMLKAKANKYDSLVEKIKEIKEIKEKSEKENKPYEEYDKESRMYWINEGKKSVCQELLEEK